MTSRRRATTLAGAAIIAIVSLCPVVADSPLAVADPTISSTASPAPAPTSSASPVTPTEQTPAPTGAAPGGAFRLDVVASDGRVIASSDVDPMSPPAGALVEPPDYARAVWIEQAAAPSSPSTGTTYIYGHACRYHACPFTTLHEATVGDRVVVSTMAGVLEYRITDRGYSMKASNRLPEFAMDSATPDRVVLVTCTFEDDGSSIENLVYAATLVGS